MPSTTRAKCSLIAAIVLGWTLPTLTLSGCAISNQHHPAKPKESHARAKGPPPWAPAHGYRHKHGDVNLVFDSGLGVYVVFELPNRYFLRGRYYRRVDAGWQLSANLSGPWVVIASDRLPPGLRSRAGAGKSKKAAKGKHGHTPPAKHGY